MQALKDLLENEVRSLIERFLRERGLELSSGKTCVTSIEQSFDLLGQNLHKHSGELLIRPPERTSKSFWPRCGGPSIGIVGAVRWVSFVSSTRCCEAGPITTATSWRAGSLRTCRWRCSRVCGAGQDADTVIVRVPGSKTVLGAGGRPERLRGPGGHGVRKAGGLATAL